MTTQTKDLELRVGEEYVFNFPGAPGSRGTFHGFPEWGDGKWVAFDVFGTLKFLNLANLNAISPYPQEDL